MFQKNKKILVLLLIAVAAFVSALLWNGEGKKRIPEKDIAVIYTNDIHTYINNRKPNDEKKAKNLSYSAVAALKEDLAAQGKAVILVDAGDHIQGTAYGDMDKGATMIQIMNETGYELATIGNHEFDYGISRILELIKKAEFPYIVHFLQDRRRKTCPRTLQDHRERRCKSRFYRHFNA